MTLLTFLIFVVFVWVATTITRSVFNDRGIFGFLAVGCAYSDHIDLGILAAVVTAAAVASQHWSRSRPGRYLS